MGHKVLKPFPFAEDGVTTRQTKKDEVLENLHPDVAAGLIAEGYISAEAQSKLAGEAIAAADHAGTVDSDLAVHQQIDSAKDRISDGLIGAPEARQIVGEHALGPLPAAEVVQAAQDEKAAHDKGDATFDPKSPEAVADATAKVEAGTDDAKVAADKAAAEKAKSKK
jgi:hypothetical protein